MNANMIWYKYLDPLSFILLIYFEFKLITLIKFGSEIFYIHSMGSCTQYGWPGPSYEWVWRLSGQCI